MTPIEKIHTFARRYCMERSADLHQERDRAKQQNSYEEYSALSARMDIMAAILIGVERLKPEEFCSRQIAAWRLVEVGQITPIRRMHQWKLRRPEDVQSMQDERARFVEAVRQFAAQKEWKRWSVEPLPFRRTLLEEESVGLMALLREQWSITKRYWLPFEKYDLPYEALVFDSAAIRDVFTIEALRVILSDHGVERLYGLGDGSSVPNRELALGLWNPYNGLGDETYWLSKQGDWLFYTTHENSTTVAGDWLLKAIKSAWPTWNDHLWVAPYEKQN